MTNDSNPVLRGIMEPGRIWNGDDDKGDWRMNGKYGDSAFGFEDLEVYAAARELRRGVYAMAKNLPEAERFVLARQMMRAALSLTNNIAEGYGRYTWQDTIHFLRQARGSLHEIADDLNMCEDQSYAQESQLSVLKDQSVKVLQLLNGYIRYLRNNKQGADS
jgi:four helix bundle protein